MSDKVTKTPQGQYVTEAPEITMMQQNLFGAWLGDPHRRYGHLASSQAVPMSTKLEMLRDETLALCVAFTGATLVKARREVLCADAAKQRFFDALFRGWEQEFVLQANVGIALGSLGLVKKWRFETPQPVGVKEPPVWKERATPYLITGFDMLYPLSNAPRFDEKGQHFQGMDTPDGALDVFDSLWLTFRKELSFGVYQGVGRLEPCYKQWWLKNFGTDLYVVALQKQANRVVQASYPPGTDPKSGKSNQQIALEVGDSARSGATVAIPSDTYSTLGLDGEERSSSVPKWGLHFLEGAGSMQGFHEIDNHHDKKMAMGYFIPPQSLFDVRGGQLGSVTSAEVLAGIAAEVLMQDAAEIDRHLNQYVFPAISKANFPPISPRVMVRTTGLAPDNREALTEIVKALLAQHPDGKYFDLREAMARLELPLKSEEQLAEDGKVAAPLEANIDLGGPGSGNWAHVGRPGFRGGSVSHNAGMTIAKGQDWLKRQAAVKHKVQIPINEATKLKVTADIASKYSPEAIDYALETLREEVTHSHIQINVRADVFLEHVLKDGRFRNQHETGTSGGVLDPNYRKRCERNAFGEQLSNPKEFPIYGWIPTKMSQKGGTSYGDLSVVLKENVRSRATLTVDDSLYLFAESLAVPSPVREIGPECLDDGISKYGTFNDIAYIEVQIFGGVRLSDIAYVKPSGYTDAETLAAVRAELAKLGIECKKPG